MNNVINTTKSGWQINEWCEATGVGRTLAYKLLNEGRIESVNVGRRRIITTHPIEFLRSCASDAA